jgi:hypothetical protein
LALLASTLGGIHAMPRAWRAWKYALQLIFSRKQRYREMRAKFDLKFHFMRCTLHEYVLNLQDLVGM